MSRCVFEWALGHCEAAPETPRPPPVDRVKERVSPDLAKQVGRDGLGHDLIPCSSANSAPAQPTLYRLTKAGQFPDFRQTACGTEVAVRSPGWADLYGSWSAPVARRCFVKSTCRCNRSPKRWRRSSDTAPRSRPGTRIRPFRAGRGADGRTAVQHRPHLDFTGRYLLARV
jgi:hypothetical protein